MKYILIFSLSVFMLIVLVVFISKTLISKSNEINRDNCETTINDKWVTQQNGDLLISVNVDDIVRVKGMRILTDKKLVLVVCDPEPFKRAVLSRHESSDL